MFEYLPIQPICGSAQRHEKIPTVTHPAGPQVMIKHEVVVAFHVLPLLLVSVPVNFDLSHKLVLLDALHEQRHELKSYHV